MLIRAQVQLPLLKLHNFLYLGKSLWGHLIMTSITCTLVPFLLIGVDAESNQAVQSGTMAFTLNFSGISVSDYSLCVLSLILTGTRNNWFC